MKIQSVHQFHSGSGYGDAVTNGMLYTKRILQNLGFDSKIYVEHVAKELENEIEHFSNFESNENNVLLLHHSMGHDLDEWIESLKDKIILVYHNITPESFFEKNSIFYNYSIKGRKQLDLLKQKAIASIGDSQLNVDELLQRGYTKDNSRVIPLLLDVDEIRNHNWNHELYDSFSNTFNIIFVGRVAENKCQHEIIEIYNKFKQKTNLKTRCFIIGGLSNDSYEAKLYETIDIYNLSDEIIVTNKVSSEDLYTYYRLADVFLCMSEHEGFGVPLVESMAFDIPVIAYDSSNIKNTLNNGGILVSEKNLDTIAESLYKISTDRAYRREIISNQRESLKIYENEHISSELVDFFNYLDIEVIQETKNLPSNNVKYQFEGPFDSTYSLAILNREMAKSMNKNYTGAVSLFSTEGGGDFETNIEFIRNMSDVTSMNTKSQKAIRSDVLLRNLYPPRVNDMRGLINLMNSYGWEESSFPKEYIENFNQHLDALPVMSKYVQKVMKDNGLTIPAPVVGVGVDHMLKVDAINYELKTNKKFKFLHISSCFPRKGVDILLDAYCSSFSYDDDVCLVIKTFPNPHNNIEEEVLKKKELNSHCPEIEIINIDLEEGYIVTLYNICDCLVAPSRGEGYGMPMAEAMLFNMPVITTGYSGQVDFCTNETAWLIDYTLEESKSHMGLFNSYWANPSYKHLSILLKNMFLMKTSEKLQKTIKAKQNILENHKWEDCTNRLSGIVKDIENKKSDDKKNNPKIGWATTWNSKCGIATYSKFLLEQFSDDVDITIFANKLPLIDILDTSEEINVQRVWKDSGEKELTSFYDAVISSNINTLVIQFNFGFFNLYALEKFINKLIQKKIKVIVEFHSAADIDKKDFKASLGWIKDSLSKVEKLLVHNIDDVNIMKKFNLIENVTLFPHGVIQSDINLQTTVKKKSKLNIQNKFIIASYGFLLPQKGIKELIKAFSEVKKQRKKSHLLLINAIYPVDESIIYAKECKELIKDLELEESITLVSDFLPDEESLKYLHCSDLIVMPYKKTKESASGAARYALSAKKPILCTPQYIFKDIDSLVHFTKDEESKSIERAILNLMENTELLTSKQDAQNRWIEGHSWISMANILSSYISVPFRKNMKTVRSKIKYYYIYVDISSLVYSGNKNENKELINILDKFIKDESIKLVTIYRDTKGIYCVANNFYPEYCEEEYSNNEEIILSKNDVFISLDMDLDITQNIDTFYFMQKSNKKGSKLFYYVKDIFPVTKPEWFNNKELTNNFARWIEFISLNATNIVCSTTQTKNDVITWIDKNISADIDIEINVIKIDDIEFNKKVTNQKKNKYIYLDISSLVYSGNKNENKELINILDKFIKDESIKLVAIYRDTKGIYCVANNFYPEYCEEEYSNNEEIILSKNDVFISLDMDLDITQNIDTFYFMQKSNKKGSKLFYYVKDIFPVTKPEWFNNKELTNNFARWIEFISLNATNIVCSTIQTKNDVITWIDKNISADIDIEINVIKIDDIDHIVRNLKK